MRLPRRYQGRRVRILNPFTVKENRQQKEKTLRLQREPLLPLLLSSISVISRQLTQMLLLLYDVTYYAFVSQAKPAKMATVFLLQVRLRAYLDLADAT